MALPHTMPHRVAPSILSGAPGIYIQVRIWRWGRFSARTRSLLHMLREYSDRILSLRSGLATIWRRAKYLRRPRTGSGPIPRAEETLFPDTGDQMRQVFTALRLGLELIQRKETAGRANEIPELVNRLQEVVSEGIQAINLLDRPYAVSQE